MGLAGFIPTVLAQAAYPHSELGIVCDDHAGIADRSEILCRIEAETSNVADTAEPAAVIVRARRLRTILDNAQSVATRYQRDRIHVGRLAIEMDWNDRLGPRRDGRFDQRRIDRVAGP